jgi:endonuclease III
MRKKLERIAKILLGQPRSQAKDEWPWLSDLRGKPASKKRANKFFLGCILDYQMDAEVVWENCRRLAQDIFDDPPDLWSQIAKVSKTKWMSKWKKYSLHRFPKAHERVWRIGREIISKYDGDARNIWKGKTPGEIFDCLQEIRVGPQISKMIIGGLIDTKQIKGISDVKADLNVKRVLGRVLGKGTLSPEEALEITRKMSPKNPWLLDQPLYYAGKDYCFKSEPDCIECYLKNECKFFKEVKSSN